MVRRCIKIYERVFAPTVLYEAERETECMLEIKCLRSMVGVTLMDRVRNRELRRSPGMERELASRMNK